VSDRTLKRREREKQVETKRRKRAKSVIASAIKMATINQPQ
jgi:hypothetical protein